MATVLERFNKLGLASSNSVLSAAGAWVSLEYQKQVPGFNDMRGHVFQEEPDGKIYLVMSYPSDWTEELDKAIWSFINQNENKEEPVIERPKRKRITSIKKQIEAGTPFTPKGSDELDNLVG